MRDLVLHFEGLESRKLFDVTVVPSPGEPPQLSVEQGEVSVSISDFGKIGTLLTVQTPGGTVAQGIGPDLFIKF